MRIVKYISTILVLSILAGCAAHSNNWPAQTRHDLKKINEVINQYNPYKYSNIKSPYAQWIDHGYDQAYQKASLVYDRKTYEDALKFYINGFKIEHLYLVFHDNFSKNTKSHIKSNNRPRLVKMAKDIALLRLPTFATQNNQALQAAFVNIENNIIKYRDIKYLIVDLRGNSGGQATYARLLMRRFYSDSFLMSLGANFIWNSQWSSTDILSPELIKNISTIKNDRQVKETLVAYNQGKNTASFSYWPAYVYKSQPTMKNPVNSTVILLTDNHCYSMCYELSRTWLSLPNVYLVGKPPNTMGLITNPVAFNISNFTTFMLASRIMTNPIDAFNRALKPFYTYDGNINDTKAVYIWIHSLINRDGFRNAQPSK